MRHNKRYPAQGTAYAIHDSFDQQRRIYAMDVSRQPAGITDEIVLKDRKLTVDLDPEGIVDDGGKVRIGLYNTRSHNWTFAYYPLDVRESPNGGWVGLSETTAL